ncbi:MAG: helix-turn-helix transcriptional regulator [Acetobacteraceae bacterium]|nr:helix-turn-helix transcriptional regulator [Acetobacteraceae bacterium]
MLSETLSAGLERYRIGAKIRALRLQKNMGQGQLAEHTGLSAALLSKIERGQLFPTLPTLLRIAMVFGVGLEHFFVDSEERPAVAVTRKGERLRLPDQPGEEARCYFFESLNFPATDRKMSAYYAEFPSSSQPSLPHRHAGVEFIFVMKGRLIVNLAGEDIALADGDATQFDSSAPHSYRRDGRLPASAIIVVLP